MLDGYKINAELSRSGSRQSFSATRLRDKSDVCIETLISRYPDSRQIAEVRREAEIATRLSDIDGVINIYDVRNYGNDNIALITEPFHHTLADLLHTSEKSPLSLQSALLLAINMVEILNKVHACGVVHKAIAPENIMICTSLYDIRIGRFGIASELTQERQAILSKRLEGPLPYISPEQTGRMRRDLDYRSDYYSFGILLFEMLTGQRPFTADSVLGWVHNHISLVPCNPKDINSAIPGPLAQIVLKLLAKSPDDRYQSGDCLLSDLKFCAESLNRNGFSDAHFTPGKNDKRSVFLMPQNLYGRDQEQQQILSFFDLSLEGRCELCLVSGYSGIGKSALVQKIGLRLVKDHGFLIQGKFDQFSQNRSYSALIRAFRGLIQQVLAAPDLQLKQWQTDLHDTLGNNAQLMIDLVPELGLIIENSPPVAALPPAESRNRLQNTLSAFVSIFAKAEHPLVLFLDDLQWSDIPTLELLKQWVTASAHGYLFIVGAYRSNELEPGHPLLQVIEEIHQTKVIHQLALRPLPRAAINTLVADALRTESKRTSQLSELLFIKAQGNPFFTLALMKKMVESGVIFFDHANEHWSWTLDNTTWSNLPEDVVSFMADNLRKLPADTQHVLQLAACIGSHFDLKTLSIIHKHSIQDTSTSLFPALKHHFVMPLSGDYKLVNNEQTTGTLQSEVNPTYQFLHDRVQQAAYSLIDSEQTPYVHQSIGERMLEHTPLAQRDDHIIEIVNHLNIARPVIKDLKKRVALAQLNVDAGRLARRTVAYERAMQFFSIANELLPKSVKQENNAFSLAITVELQQSAYLTGRLEDAERYMQIMLDSSETDLQRGEFLATQARQYATLGKMEASIFSAIHGLQNLGFDVSSQPTQNDILEERKRINAHLKGVDIMMLAESAPCSNERVLIANRLLMEVFPAAFLSGNGNLLPYLVQKSVNLALEHGIAPESAFAYAAFGMLLCGDLDEQRLGYQFGLLGLAINKRLDNIELQTRVIYVYAMFIHHWNAPWSTLTPWFRKGIKSGYQSGDLLYLAYSAQDCVIWDPMLDLETMLSSHSENLEIVRKTGYQDSIDSATLFLQLIKNHRGQTITDESLSCSSFDELQCLQGMRERKFMTGIANYHIYKAEACFLHGFYHAALDHIGKQDKLVKSAMSLPQLVRFFIIAFLTHTALYNEMSDVQKNTALRRMNKDLLRMRHWATNCPENFLHLQQIMEAELARINTPNTAHLPLYEAAINTANDNGFIRDKAVACERAARHLIALGWHRSAEGYLIAAHQAFSHWGARRKVSLLESEFSILNEIARHREAAAREHNYGGINANDLDLASVMKASRAISGEIVLSRLMQKILDILLENAGAQWGCFVVRREGVLSIEAKSGKMSNDNNQLPQTIINDVLHNNMSVILHNASQEGTFTDDPYVKRFKPESILCVPVQRGQIQGAVYMENNLATEVFSESRLEVVSLLAAQATVAIENASLYEQIQSYSRTLEEKVAKRTTQLEALNEELKKLADSDGLTGLSNRRHFDYYLKETWNRLRREQGQLSVVLFDVDHFKTYNDTYGHQAGDDCLVAIAKAVRETIKRPADLVARYGGEEFVIVLPDTNIKGAILVAESIREAIQDLKIPHSQSSVGRVITVSAGVATIIPDSQSHADALIESADKALYKAKERGRNRVVSPKARLH